MIKFLSGRGIKHIGLISPPPVNEAQWSAFWEASSSNRTTEAVKLYAEVVENIVGEGDGSERGVVLYHVDVFNGFQKYGKDWKSQLFSDGLHLNDRGNTLVADAVSECIQRIFGIPRFNFDDWNTFIYPHWSICGDSIRKEDLRPEQ